MLALGPGLGRGYLLSYDMVMTPREPFTPAMAGLAGGPPRAVPSDAVVAAVSRLIPADLAQKLILLSIFVLACSGAAALLRGAPWYARAAAGICYAWNPYLAERLIIGQWALLLGYAGLPWALRAASSARLATWRGAGRLGLALLPAAVGGFAAMSVSALVVLPAAAFARQARGEPGAGAEPGAGRSGPARRRLARLATALALLTMASLPWLVPSLLRPVYADPRGVAAFAARADTPFGSFGSLVMLSGIWNARAVPAGYGGAWSALWLLFAVAAAGAFALRAARRWPGLAAAATAGLALACVGLTTGGRELLRAAAGQWPGFAVLRDAQQFIAPLALAQALGAGLLADWAAIPRRPARRSARRETVPRVPGPHVAGPQVTGPQVTGTHVAGPRPDGPGLVFAAVIMLAPVLLLPGLAWSAAGRLRPVSYPASWLAAARAIDQSRARGAVLLLPWAAYRTPGWNHWHTMLDPWPRLLSRTVIWNDGVQVGSVRLAPDESAARRLGPAVLGHGPLTSALRAAGVAYVISDSGPGPGRRLPGCALVVSRPPLFVYQVPAPVART